MQKIFDYYRNRHNGMTLYQKILWGIGTFVFGNLIVWLAFNIYDDNAKSLVSINDISRIELVGSEQILDVELALSQEQRRVGLMNREELGKNNGMLFVFDKETDNGGFWMKDTLIPLDIIFIDTDLNVVGLFKDVQPCDSDPCSTYDPKNDYKYVVETNSGYWSEVEIGKELIFY